MTRKKAVKDNSPTTCLIGGRGGGRGGDGAKLMQDSPNSRKIWN